MPSLAVFSQKHQVFQSNGPWLYPLLELESWLAKNPIDTSELEIYDKIVGRAGAMLICRLGFRSVTTDLISELAVEVFDRHGVSWVAEQETDRILCATESLLETENDLEAAHELILERARQSRSSGSTLLLSVHDLNVLVDGRHVLSAIDLEIHRGERVLISGNNGAGKTTLLRCILGLHPINTGRIRFRGADTGSAAWKRMRSELAYVRQHEVQGSLVISAREVAGIGGRSDGGLALTDVAHLARRPVTELSGGERRRVSLARAFSGEPSLVVLDEPTTGLDPHARNSLLGLIDSVAGERGTAVLMVSHENSDQALEGWRRYHLVSGRLEET